MLKIHSDKDTMTAFLTGELDHHSCAVMRKAIDLKAEQERPRILVLDFSGVQFMDSSGIGLVMGRYRHMSLLGGRLSVENVPVHLEKIMRLSGLSSLGVMK